MFLIIVVFCALFIGDKFVFANNPAVISKYANVAHWGAASPSSTTEKEQFEGRSNSGQTFWTQRSDAKINTGQNLKAPKPVVYQYPVNKKVGDGKNEPFPGVGEVIQERFNPRPYFDYDPAPMKSAPPKKSNGGSRTQPQYVPPVQAPVFSPPPPRPPPTFDSFPVFKQPPVLSKPPSDLYASSFSSYNPPKMPPSESGSPPQVAYPPNASPPSEMDSYAAPPDSGTVDAPPSIYGPPKTPSMDYDPPKPPSFDYGPPKDSDDSSKPVYATPVSDMNDDHPDHSQDDDHDDDHDHDHDHDHGMDSSKDDDHKDDGKDDELFYPPSDDKHHPEVILDHPPPGYEEDKPSDSNMDMGMGMGMGMGMDMGNSDMMNGGSMPMGHDMGEQDLSPPPSSNMIPKFPSYLYSDHGHDFDSYFDHHHVYKEVTTTTTPAPEDERVNKGQYSYYYLGRKLWYIPLYFSIYFIIYVFVLILKSIARHKIQFKHKFHYDTRSGRNLDIVDEIHKNVTNSLETSSRKFGGYIAM